MRNTTVNGPASNAQAIELELHISTESYLKDYQLAGAVVIATARDGRSVQFPARILRRFVTHAGVHGWFRIQFDASGSFGGIERLDDDAGLVR